MCVWECGVCVCMCVCVCVCVEWALADIGAQVNYRNLLLKE